VSDLGQVKVATLYLEHGFTKLGFHFAFKSIYLVHIISFMVATGKVQTARVEPFESEERQDYF
jgi:hypothetical protein